MFAPTMRCGVIKVCGINNNAKRWGVGTSDFCKAEIAPFPYNSEIITNSEHGRTLFAPTVIWDSLFLRKIAPLFADFTLCRRIVKRCRFYTPISLLSDIWLLYAFDTTICTLSACAEWGSASFSARGFAPRPHKPSSAGLERALYLSLRSVLYFTLCVQFTLVCYAHSSLLT